MALKRFLAAVVCTGVLVLGGAATADEYRPDEFLRLSLPKALLSSKRLGPDAEFAPIPIEARSDRSDRAQADLDTSVWPKLPAPAHVVKTETVKPHVAKVDAPHTSARTKLAHRRSNPLDAQARDTRVQTWPCRSGGICNWQR